MWKAIFFVKLLRLHRNYQKYQHCQTNSMQKSSGMIEDTYRNIFLISISPISYLDAFFHDFCAFLTLFYVTYWHFVWWATVALHVVCAWIFVLLAAYIDVNKKRFSQFFLPIFHEKLCLLFLFLWNFLCKKSLFQWLNKFLRSCHYFHNNF